MTSQADIIIRSSDEQVYLVVEVKGMKGVSDEWAAKYRRNLYAHHAIPKSTYFMLAMPEYIYLWKNHSNERVEGSENPLVFPNYKMPTKDLLQPYLKGLNLNELSENGLQFVISAWLGDLLTSDLTQEKSNQKYDWLFESGLYNGIKDGSITTEIFA